jgi:hypothetical protein
MAARRYDVLVLGGDSQEPQSRQAPATIRNLMDATESDVVLVKAPSAHAAFAASAASGRQKGAN